MEWTRSEEIGIVFRSGVGERRATGDTVGTPCAVEERRPGERGQGMQRKLGSRRGEIE